VTRLFGTDGIRGVAGEWPLDPLTVARIGAAVVRVLGSASPVRLVIGRDTRESGAWIERELARGAASEGALVTSIGIAPTPAVAYCARRFDFDLGLVISASHNAYRDNGIKVFSGRGEKFGSAEERAVEAIVADSSWTVDGADPPIVEADLIGRYLDHVRELLPEAGPLAGARLAIDLANGATTTTAARVLGAIGFDLEVYGAAPDGRNINLDCGSTHPDALAALVVDRGCRLGIAFDGDGDRAIFVDDRGRIVDGDAILFLCAVRLHDRGALPHETVVATVMSNVGLELALAARGIRLVRTPVGDRHVMEEMRRCGYALGGEQSGHIILAEHLFTGDGLATALAVLRLMAESGRELADLAADLVTYPQVLLSVRVREKRDVATVREVADAMTCVEDRLGGRGRLLVRYSGTEPVLRIMIEGEDQAAIDGMARQIADAAASALG
jgi:phosphoglucosamine mutase